MTIEWTYNLNKCQWETQAHGIIIEGENIESLRAYATGLEIDAESIHEDPSRFNIMDVVRNRSWKVAPSSIIDILAAIDHEIAWVVESIDDLQAEVEATENAQPKPDFDNLYGISESWFITA